MLNDWAIVKFNSFDAEIYGDKNVKLDPKKDIFETGEKTFIVGNYQVSKCWDIAI